MSLKKTTNSSEATNKATDEAAAPPLDFHTLAQLKEILGDEMTQVLAQQFIENAQRKLIALQHCITMGDIETLRRTAHQFKGESLQMGAIQLGALCQTLEQLAQDNQVELATTSLTQIQIELARVAAALTQVGNHD